MADWEPPAPSHAERAEHALAAMRTQQFALGDDFTDRDRKVLLTASTLGGALVHAVLAVVDAINDLADRIPYKD